MDLKERLRTLRAERGYSLRELSERIERETGERMSFSYLSELERLGGTPSIDVLTKIAAGYGLSVQALLAPVGMTGNLSDDRYPPGLLEFANAAKLDADWLDTLASVQFRGERPATAEEWKAVFNVLDGVINLMASQKRGGME
jgi:transcriptional regulator with XRE-family HTH domain